MNFDSNIPIYLQIVEIIKKEIATGRIKSGDKLSSVREVSQRYGVNPNTVQRAFCELENQKVTYVQRGKGMYVVEALDISSSVKEEMAENILKKFMLEMASLGFHKTQIRDKLEKILKDNDSGVNRDNE